MLRRAHLLAPLLALAWAAPARALTPADAAVITQIEALRLPPDTLGLFATSADASTRARAARALARLGLASGLPLLKPLLEDSSPTVRAEAAFALGRVPGGAGLAQRRLAQETDAAVRAALVRALGHQGDAGVIDTLVAALGESGTRLRPSPVPVAAAEALGRLGQRGVAEARTEAVGRALLALLEPLPVDRQRAAAFALARLRVEGGADWGAALVAATAAAGDAEARAFLVRAMAAAKDAPGRDAVLHRLSLDPAPGVRTAVARAAGPLRWAGVVALLGDADVGVRREAIAAVGLIGGPTADTHLWPLLRAGDTIAAAEAGRVADDPRVLLAAEALKALCTAGVVGDPSPWRALERPTPIRVAAVEATTDRAALAALALKDGETAVRSAAAAALLALGPKSSEVEPLLGAFDRGVAGLAAEWLSEHPTSKAAPALQSLLDPSLPPDVLEPALAALVAGGPPGKDPKDAARRAADSKKPASAKSKDNAKEKAQAKPTEPSTAPAAGSPAALAAALPPLLTHPDPGVRAAAADLARRLGQTATPVVHSPLPLPAASPPRSARILTDRGEILVELWPEDAPVTVENFARLAESGFYEGVLWHRVVPDFVVQTGDPRGDGLGGSGARIPDELSPRPYTPGVLGMALSGPDTGTSQWFITLSRQPHLDASYTAFGRVLRGLDVARALRPGDRVRRVIIERPPAPAPGA